MKLKVEFSGGLELLFNKNKKMDLEMESNDQTKLTDLIEILKGKIVEKHDFFLTKDNQIRPGIIVLINDSDWEIFEKENTILADGDTISFISTLHGG